MLEVDAAAETPTWLNVGLPIVLAIVALVASVLPALVSNRSDDLKHAQRLGELARDMASPSTERDLVEKVRNDYVVAWALRKAAPPSSLVSLVALFYVVEFAAIGFALYLLVAEFDLAWLALPLFVVGYAALGLALLGTYRWTQERHAWLKSQRAKYRLRDPINERLKLEAGLSEPQRSSLWKRPTAPVDGAATDDAESGVDDDALVGSEPK